MENESHVVNRPFDANDEEPYIFVSYKHSDWRAVYSVIKRFNEAGFNIWYDAGLRRGKSYDIEIATHIKNAELFITFITEKVIECSCDANDYLVMELSAANHLRKNTLPIMLDESRLDGYYLMHYAGIKSIVRSHYGDDEDLFIEDCLRAFEYDFGIKPVEREADL